MSDVVMNADFMDNTQAVGSIPAYGRIKNNTTNPLNARWIGCVPGN
jgi:hypothetical protein